ncbi:hypothetical protein DOT98_12260 [Clavibacter michiganensis subsp. michiganensis]|nr:hypothetical protein [Clavibacter michiganensis subsp. michiganensis]MWJ41890.1 hypothetical protein [Clavibacter michiganensis subsp. michiganensis]
MHAERFIAEQPLNIVGVRPENSAMPDDDVWSIVLESGMTQLTCQQSRRSTYARDQGCRDRYIDTHCPCFTTDLIISLREVNAYFFSRLHKRKRKFPIKRRYTTLTSIPLVGNKQELVETGVTDS